MEWGSLLGWTGAALVVPLALMLYLRAQARPRPDVAPLVGVSDPAPDQPRPSAPPPPPPDGLTDLFDDGPCPGPTGAVFDRWRQFGPSPRLSRAIDKLRGGLAASAALARLEDPNLHLTALKRVIATDPVLTSTILRLANSPLYGVRPAVESLAQAIGIMGLTGIQTVLYAEMIEASVIRSGLHPALGRLLREHLAVAGTLARHIAPAFAGLDPSQLETLAILHDIGKLALYQDRQSAFFPDVAAEVQAFGVDHALAGALVCQGFDLPATMLAGIALHHAPLYVEMEALRADLREIEYAVALCLTDRLTHRLLSVPAAETGPRTASASARPGLTSQPAIRDSYRFLIKEPRLAACLADPDLTRAIRQTRGLVRDLAGQDRTGA